MCGDPFVPGMPCETWRVFVPNHPLSNHRTHRTTFQNTLELHPSSTQDTLEYVLFCFMNLLRIWRVLWVWSVFNLCFFIWLSGKHNIYFCSPPNNLSFTFLATFLLELLLLACRTLIELVAFIDHLVWGSTGIWTRTKVDAMVPRGIIN
jgi:hypothetical protein